MKLRSFLHLFSLALIFLLISCEKKSEDATQKPAFKQGAEIVTPQPLVPPSTSPSTSPSILDSSQYLPTEIPIPPAPLEEIPREYTFAEKLVQAALERTTHDVTYDGRYLKIAFPMGDVPNSIGVCTDVIIRSYRELGIDLQQLVHEDIRKNFKLYPNQQRWGLTRPDTNIDHRRVPNLRVFLSRHGESLPVSDRSEDYLPGDLVTWKLNEKMLHIGIVADEKAYMNPSRNLIIHNIGRGPELSDILFDYEITGHYRYTNSDSERSKER